MRSLPPSVRFVLVDVLGMRQIEPLLALPDRRILAAVEASRRVEHAALQQLRRWLARERHGRSARPNTPIETKARADELMLLALHDIADAVRSAVAHDRVTPDELARRCGTSRDGVQTVLAGGVPSTLETAFRLAAGLGLRVQIGTSPIHARGGPSP